MLEEYTMESWESLPYTILLRIYNYLPRRDRFACSMVCKSWNDALNSPSLWKNLLINLDTDLFDPTVLVIVRKYYKYFTTLELGWANSHPRLSWAQQRPDISRRACKFLMVLSETNIQLETIKFIDWYEGRKLKKIIYHISKFLKNQRKLVNISFFMVNFNKTDCTKLLSCCLESQKSIRNVQMSYCLYLPNNSQEHVLLISSLECLSHLKFLKTDYSFFVNGVLEAIITSKANMLKSLEIYVRGYPSFHESVPDKEWEKLKEQNPQIEVSFYFVEVCHFEEINVVLKEVIPVVTISLSCGKMWNRSRSRQYRRTLQLIARNYRKTLENLYIHIKFNTEVLDDVLVGIFQKCLKLQHFEFSGVVQNLGVIKELFETYGKKNKSNFTSVYVCPKRLDSKSQYSIEKLFDYFSEEKKTRPLDFQISETHYDKCVVYMYN